MKRRKVRLRAPGPGDLGWVVQAHGALYAREFRYNRDFEGLVAGIVADFVRNYDATRERCWIAEVDSENAGAVFCVRQAPTVAKLRLLILDPGRAASAWARAWYRPASASRAPPGTASWCCGHRATSRLRAPSTSMPDSDW